MKRLLMFLFFTVTIANAGIARTGSCSASTTSCSLSAVNAGDFVIAWAFNAKGATIPSADSSVDSGTTIDSGTAGSTAFRLSCHQASDGSDTSSGTYANATAVVALAYSGTNVVSTATCPTTGMSGVGRSTNPNSAPPHTSTSNAIASATASYGSIPLQTGILTTGTNWVLAFLGDSGSSTCTPAGLTNVSATGSVRASDSNGVFTPSDTGNFGIEGWPTTTCTVSSSSTWMSYVVELVPAQTGDYAVSFTATENPIKQSGKWLNGKADGIDWNDIETVPAKAFGNSYATPFTDPTAVLNTGQSWSQGATACGVVYMQGTPTSSEVELRLNTSVSPHSITGYELDFAASLGDGNPYQALVRWNGPLNNFTYIGTINGSPSVSNSGRAAQGPGLNQGDRICGKNINGTIHYYINDQEPLYAAATGSFCGYTQASCGGATGFPNVAVDSTYTRGAPGIGTCCETSGSNTDHGWVSFSATGAQSIKRNTVIVF